MSKVTGSNVMGYVFLDGIYKPVVCATSLSMSFDTELLKTSRVGNNGYATFIGAEHSISATLSGIVTLQQVNSVAFPDLRALQKARTEILFRYQRTDADANVYADEWMALIKNTSDEASTDGMNTFTATLQGTGGITVIFTPTPINTGGKVIDFNYIATGGETFFSDPELIGRDIVGAFKSQNYRVILSGTPVNQETKYTSASGRFDWPIALDPGEHVLIQYQEI